MKAYSEDLRGRVIRSVETGRPREEVAAHCEVFSVPGLIGADDHIATLPGWTVARVHQFVDAIAAATDRTPDDLVQTAFTRARQQPPRAPSLPSQEEGLGEGVSLGDPNPITPSPGLASTFEHTPWQPRSHA